MSNAFYIDTVINGKSVHKFSIKSGDKIVGSDSLDELIEYVLDKGIDPTTLLYTDGEATGETLCEFIIL